MVRDAEGAMRDEILQIDLNMAMLCCAELCCVVAVILPA